MKGGVAVVVLGFEEMEVKDEFADFSVNIEEMKDYILLLRV